VRDFEEMEAAEYDRLAAEEETLWYCRALRERAGGEKDVHHQRREVHGVNAGSRTVEREGA